MKRSRMTRFAIGASLITFGSALAFEPGGHHDSLSAIFADSTPTSSAAVGLPTLNSSGDLAARRRLEAFCAQLPDLSQELDAITQREHVVISPIDWGWGAFTICTTKTSRHMVASQFFLHALTGGASHPLREVAAQIVASIDADFAKAADDATRTQLTCERGFAEHLFGDTYAHSTTDDETRLYATGFGHAREFDHPDRMLYRPDRWYAWLAAAGPALVGHATDPAIAVLSQGVNASSDSGYGEQDLVEKLHNHVQMAAFWEPYQPALDGWTTTPHPSSIPVIGAVVDLYNNDILFSRCQDQVDHGPANRPGGLGAPTYRGNRPNCDQVWAGYFARAKSIFAAAKVTAPCDVDPSQDRLEDGQ
jgi:hypothetical protein